MEFLTALFLLFVFGAIFGAKKGKRRSRRKTSNRQSSPTKRSTPAARIAAREPKPDPYVYLYDRWKEVSEGKVKVPAWYHDPVTERQLQRLRDDEIKLPGRPISKGQASDLIGLGEPTEPEQLEILRFFKVTGLPLKHYSIAAIEIDRIMSDPEKARQWNNRPANAIQKEYYRYFGITAPKGLTATEAEATIASHELSDDQWDDWDAYSDLIEELQDKDFREDYELKKPSIPVIRQAIERHTKEGIKITELSADDLVDTLFDIKPDLRKT